MSAELFAAARAGNVEALRFLLDSTDIDAIVPNAVDAAGRTAIFYAQLGGHVGAAALLAERGWTPMAQENLFAGSGGRLCFWNDPRGPLCSNATRPAPHQPMVNWTVRPLPLGKAPERLRATLAERWPDQFGLAGGAPQASAAAKRPKGDSGKAKKKAAVAWRKKQRAIDYHSAASIAQPGKDHPLYPRRPMCARRGRGRAAHKPSLGFVGESDDRLDYIDEDAEMEWRDVFNEEDEDAAAAAAATEEAAAEAEAGEGAAEGGEAQPPPVSRAGVSDDLDALALGLPRGGASRSPSSAASSVASSVASLREGSVASEGGEHWVVVPDEATGEWVKVAVPLRREEAMEEAAAGSEAGDAPPSSAGSSWHEVGDAW